MEMSTDDKPTPSEVFNEGSQLAKECDIIISRRYGDPNVLPYLNVRLSFMKFIAGNEAAIEHIQDLFLWTPVALMLKSLSIPFQNHQRIESEEFPWQKQTTDPCRRIGSSEASSGLTSCFQLIGSTATKSTTMKRLSSYLP